MIKRVSAIDAGSRFEQIINAISLEADDYIVETAGEALVAIVPIKKYNRMEQERETAKKELFGWIAEVREKTKNTPPEIIESEIEEAVASVRAKTGRKFKTAVT